MRGSPRRKAKVAAGNPIVHLRQGWFTAVRKTLRATSIRPVFELLEERIALSITIDFDYSRDTSGFFSANPITQTLLQEAGQTLGSQLNNQLAAITPDPTAQNTWTLSPPFGGDFTNPSLAADTILVEVVGTALGPSGFAGEAGPSGYSASGSQAWVDTVQTRGANSSSSAVLGGAINFNTTVGWFTQNSDDQSVFNQSFFYGVALHELGHVLGLGTSQAWTNYVDSANNTFTGPHAEASYGGAVPLDPSAGDATKDAHWAETDLSDGQIPVMIPIYQGAQAYTSLDWAGLSDVGWSIDHLAITTQPPPDVTAGASFGLDVSAVNPLGSVDTLYNGSVTLSLAADPGGATLGGTLTATAVNGVAEFAGLTLGQIASGYTIQAVAGGLPATTTDALAVTPAADSPRLEFTTEPPTAVVAGVGFGLTVAFDNANGQLDAAFNGPVTLSLAVNPGGATLGGTVSVNAANGVATFTGLSLDPAAAGYTFAAMATGGAGATSSYLTVTHAAATHLVVTAQPPGELVAGQSTSVTVAAEDAYGNVDTSFDGQFTINLAANPGGDSLQSSGSASNGVITAGLTLNQPGNGYTFLFTCINNGWSVTTSPVNVSASLSSSPAIIGERILTAGKGKRKHFVGFEVIFSEPLDSSSAVDRANYEMTQAVKRGRKTVNKAIKFSVQYAGGSNLVDLLVAGKPAFAKGGRIVLIATPPGGIADTAGNPLVGNATLVILPKARGVVG